MDALEIQKVSLKVLLGAQLLWGFVGGDADETDLFVGCLTKVIL